MSVDWKALVRTVAPALATALGGPLAGLAVQAISTAVLGRADGSEEDVVEALAKATPDTLLALRKANQDFEIRLRELDIDIERIDQADRASARQREVATGDVWTPRLLAGGVTAGFFGVLVWLLAYGIPVNGGEALLVMLGSLGTAWAGVISYYFGSSAGSRYKSDLLAKAEAIR